MTVRKKATGVSESVVRRLPRYYRKLAELERRGIVRVSSGELALELDLNPSQIRQDFNCFGGFGLQGFGYPVAQLRQEMAAILGLVRKHRGIVVGAGHIGQALVHYLGFGREGFDILGIFDIKDSLIGTRVGPLTVLHAATLGTFVPEHNVDIGVIAAQKEAAQRIAESLEEAGIAGIWNFSAADVDVGVPVENVNMNDSLFILTYRMKLRY